MADIQLFARHYTNALDGLLRVVSWRKVTYGKDHIKTLMVVQRVGMAHTCLGRLGEALPYSVEAADGYMTLEPHSASTVTALEIVAETAKKIETLDHGREILPVDTGQYGRCRTATPRGSRSCSKDTL
jgi:hypothetical protein